MSEPLSQRTPVQLGLFLAAASAIWLAAADHWKVQELERRLGQQEALNLAVRFQQLEDGQKQVTQTLREVVLVLRDLPAGKRRLAGAP